MRPIVLLWPKVGSFWTDSSQFEGKRLEFVVGVLGRWNQMVRIAARRCPSGIFGYGYRVGPYGVAYRTALRNPPSYPYPKVTGTKMSGNLSVIHG